MSRPVRGKLMLVLAFLLTLAAGVVVGIGLSQRVAANPTLAISTQASRPPERSWLAGRLSLDQQQQARMQEIWSKAMEGHGRSLFEARRALYHEREEALNALYTDDQRSKREQIFETYAAKLDANEKEREKYVQGAVDETKKILTDEQRREYEKLLAERDRGDWRRPGGPTSSRSTSRPSPSHLFEGFKGEGFKGDGMPPSHGPDSRGDRDRRHYEGDRSAEPQEGER